MARNVYLILCIVLIDPNKISHQLWYLNRFNKCLVIYMHTYQRNPLQTMSNNKNVSFFLFQFIELDDSLPKKCKVLTRFIE